jgi:hypothetical protein
MRKSDGTGPKCSAGYRRIELIPRPGTKGACRCLFCDEALGVLDGKTDVGTRLTVQPEKMFE